MKTSAPSVEVSRVPCVQTRAGVLFVAVVVAAARSANAREMRVAIAVVLLVTRILLVPHGWTAVKSTRALFLSSIAVTR